MTRENDTGAELRAGAGGQALDQGLKQHAAQGPSASGNNSLPVAVKQARACVVCGAMFTPNRTRFRRCLACSRALKAALVEHARKRNADGCTVFKLLEFLPKLRSDDAACAAWLASLAEKPADV
jgi:hypothetical protein